MSSTAPTSATLPLPSPCPISPFYDRGTVANPVAVSASTSPLLSYSQRHPALTNPVLLPNLTAAHCFTHHRHPQHCQHLHRALNSIEHHTAKIASAPSSLPGLSNAKSILVIHFAIVQSSPSIATKPKFSSSILSS